MRRKREDYPTRVKLLQIALEMYTERGFTNTTNQMIADAAHCSTGQITNFFQSKENILYEVLRQVLPFHQETLAESAPKDAPPAVRYALEIAIEIAFCEKIDTVRDLYMNAYTLPKTFDYIREYSCRKSISLFADHLPSWSEQDFFETEALSMGIVYAGGLMDRCSETYTLQAKIARVLDALLKIYEFAQAERAAVVKIVLDRDIERLACEAESQMRTQVREAIRTSVIARE